MILLGTLTVGGRTFTKEDSTGKVYREYLGLPDSFYGGNAKSFLKTKEGFLLCLDKKDNILNMGYFEDQLSNEGLKLLLKHLGKEVPFEIPSNVPPVETNETLTSLDYKGLKALAREIGVEGRITTMKGDELRKKIQIKLAEKLREDMKE